MPNGGRFSTRIERLLCFVSCKYGRLPTKQLKSVLIDFYNEEAISKAKVCLLNDIIAMDMSSCRPMGASVACLVILVSGARSRYWN